LVGRHHTGRRCQLDRRMDLAGLGGLVISPPNAQSWVTANSSLEPWPSSSAP
jgi:hypothetical protein